MGPGLPDDATAQTLNYALGNLGGSQKSWMTLPSSAPALPPVVPAELATNPLPFTVRGRGRPRKRPIAVAVPTTTTPASTEYLNTRPTVEIEQQSLSNSTSPQLPNVVAHQSSANHGHSVAHVFPSPTPSEDTWGPPKRLSEGHVQQAEKRRRSEAFGQNQPAPVSNTTNDHPYPPRRPSGHHSQIGSPLLNQTNSRSPSLGMMASPQLPQGMQFQASRINGTPPQPHAPYGPPQAFSQAPNPRPLSRSAHPENPSRASSALQISGEDWYWKQNCLQILANFQSSQATLPDNPQYTKRLGVLRDATETMDWSYLTMHQYYCLLTHFPHELPDVVRTTPGLQHAHRMLRDVLDSNQKLPPSYLHFFANFPYPIQQIAAMWPAKFEHHVQLFRQFVVQSHNYDQLKATCERRRCPPLTQELAINLRIASPMFQRLLFTAFLRCIWRSVMNTSLHKTFEANAIAVFQQNQVDWHTRQNHPGLTTPEYHQQEKEYEDRIWGSRLRALVGDFEATLRAQGVSLADHHYGAQPQQQVQAPPSQPQQVQAHQFQPRQLQNSSPSIGTVHQMPPRPSRSIDPHSAQAAIQQSRGPGRPPSRPTQTTRPPSASPGIPLLPALRYQLPQQRVPNPARYGLHQAHLRSPVLRAESKSSLLYTFNQNFLKPPARLSGPGRTIEIWTFTLSPNDIKRIGKTLKDTAGGPGTVHITETTKFARLRCVSWPASEWTENLWAVADTSWIPHSYFTLNGTPLEQRKKVYYGKDLPIDLTGLLKEGENVLEIVVMAQSGDTSHLKYMIAIEAMVVSSHESIRQHCLNSSRVPADKVLQGIKNKLTAVDDDEITVVESTLTINMFDPFSQAKMCDIPVRSRACPHNDCFDLETFLNSRPRKGDASVADQWKCPICKSDARPQMLIVDGFKEDVKKQLESRGLAHTRQIIIQQDGSWHPKAEVSEGVSDNTPEPAAAAAANAARRSVPADVEIIDLSD